MMLAQLETARSRWREGYHVEEDAGTPTTGMLFLGASEKEADGFPL